MIHLRSRTIHVRKHAVFLHVHYYQGLCLFSNKACCVMHGSHHAITRLCLYCSMPICPSCVYTYYRNNYELVTFL